MTPSAKLKDIIEGMDFQSEDLSFYLNKKTGEVVSVMSESFSAAEEKETLEDFPKWQHEDIATAGAVLTSPDDYISLPSKFEIHEREIMEHFCLSIANIKVRDALLGSIRGSGAFRRFKDNIERYDLVENWHLFRHQAIKEIAIDWCERNEIRFADDVISS